MVDIINFDGETKLELEADKVLDAAKGRVEDCIIAGWDKDGELYLATTSGNMPEIIFILEHAKNYIMKRSTGDI